MAFVDDFDGTSLDREAWLPHYLPHWSSRAASAATYAVEGSELRLTIPRGQGLWCEDTHDDPPLRVSGVQSGAHDGQQPFRERQAVRQPGPTWWGVTPHFGRGFESWLGGHPIQEFRGLSDILALITALAVGMLVGAPVARDRA